MWLKYCKILVVRLNYHRSHKSPSLVISVRTAGTEYVYISFPLWLHLVYTNIYTIFRASFKKLYCKSAHWTMTNLWRTRRTRTATQVQVHPTRKWMRSRLLCLNHRAAQAAPAHLAANHPATVMIKLKVPLLLLHQTFQVEYEIFFRM